MILIKTKEGNIVRVRPEELKPEHKSAVVEKPTKKNTEIINEVETTEIKVVKKKKGKGKE